MVLYVGDEHRAGKLTVILNGERRIDRVSNGLGHAVIEANEMFGLRERDGGKSQFVTDQSRSIFINKTVTGGISVS